MKQSELVEVKRPQSSVHDLSHEVKMTAKMGELTPILTQEVLPGDNFKVNTETLLRMQPLLAPMMHRVNTYIHYFFVPNRIIWDDWESFITGGKDGTEAPNHPKITGTLSDWTEEHASIGSLCDFLGLPVENMANEDPSGTLEVSQLAFRAYQRIYNEYYRDPNLVNEIEQHTSSSNIGVTSTEGYDLLDMRQRAWEKDYFTATLPTPQRGEEVMLPLGQTAPIQLNESELDGFASARMVDASGNGMSGTSGLKHVNPLLQNDANTTTIYDPNGTLEADLSNATAASINDWRRSMALQRWLEKNMRGGHRYFEQLFSHFGVKSPDHRLQRPEYLGGGKMPVKISEVLQTSETNSTTDSAQGNMSGHGFATGSNAHFKSRFQEHGFVIGIMSIMPRTAYQQGVAKMHVKFDRFDYYWPEFAHIGEEAVKNRELYLTGSVENDEGTFGYNPRYQDYRYAFDRVAGNMRGTMDFWHLGRKFTSPPSLNKTFVECRPDNRIWPITNGEYDHFIVQIYNKITAIRPVVKHGTPI